MNPSFPFDAVLFDCDGVLVDSEPITNGVLRDMLEDLRAEIAADAARASGTDADATRDTEGHSQAD